MEEAVRTPTDPRAMTLLASCLLRSMSHWPRSVDSIMRSAGVDSPVGVLPALRQLQRMHLAERLTDHPSPMKCCFRLTEDGEGLVATMKRTGMAVPRLCPVTFASVRRMHMAHLEAGVTA
jgi:hypothetical protein